jgi:hypothetical protein
MHRDIAVGQARLDGGGDPARISRQGPPDLTPQACPTMQSHCFSLHHSHFFAILVMIINYQKLGHGAMLTTKRLKMAGYLAMTSAMMTVPWFLFTFNIANRNNPVIRAAEASMLVGGLALLAYLLLTFQQLLHTHYAFHQADKTISLLIQASIVQTAASLLGLAIPELDTAARMYGIVMVVVVGILHMMFGLWLLQLPASLGGMHRPYCYLNIVTGFALASVLLLPLGMLTSTIADVMLGTIFLQAVGHPPKLDPQEQ